MITHTVFFWLDPELSDEARGAFEQGLKSLLTIPHGGRAFYARPAQTPKREVIDDSYDYALELDFHSLHDQDVYQEHPTHLAFLEAHKAKWVQVRVYDFEHLS
jgi:hypothetical protein